MPPPNDIHLFDQKSGEIADKKDFTRLTIKKFIFVICTVFVFIVGLKLLVNLTSELFQNKIESEFDDKSFKQSDLLTPYYPISYYRIKKIRESSSFIEKLQENDLWDISADESIFPVVFSNYPADINKKPVHTKKKLFFNALLPAVLIVEAEINLEKKTLQNIATKITKYEPVYNLRPEKKDWQKELKSREVHFIHYLTAKYKTHKLETLLSRVDIIPPSLVLAQAAIESSWGTSRFSRDGNNLFGIWTWGNEGMVPQNRDIGKTHRVASYDSLIQSIRAYYLNLNRVFAYQDFREIRKETKDSMFLVEGLLRYSERGEAYVDELTNIIKNNELKKYDNYSLKTLKKNRYLKNLNKG